MHYFFYGTLLDRGLLARVIGRPVPEARIEGATLKGYRRLRMAGTPYPMLARERGTRVDGILVRGLDQTAARRLADYEGARYTVQVLPVVGSRSGVARARVFMAKPGIKPSCEPWDFERRFNNAQERPGS